jgi:hypothetical protein
MLHLSLAVPSPAATSFLEEVQATKVGYGRITRVGE